MLLLDYFAIFARKREIIHPNLLLFLDVVVEAVDTTPSVPSFKQHNWSFLPWSHRLFHHLFGQEY